MKEEVTAWWGKDISHIPRGSLYHDCMFNGQSRVEEWGSMTHRADTGKIDNKRTDAAETNYF
jgi:hypothetical protein